MHVVEGVAPSLMLSERLFTRDLTHLLFTTVLLLYHHRTASALDILTLPSKASAHYRQSSNVGVLTCESVRISQLAIRQPQPRANNTPSLFGQRHEAHPLQ